VTHSAGYWERLAAAVKDLITDGCSNAPDRQLRACCDEHDFAYRTGMDVDGVRVSRREADARFYECVKAGDPGLAPIYWAGVRLFGKRAWHGGA
jgi:hypothetical protein